MKNPNISIVFLDFSVKSKKRMEIQNSNNPKHSQIFLKVLDFWIFGFSDFGILLKNPKIQKSQRFSRKFWIFGFFDFSENCVFALCYTNFLLNLMTDNKKMKVLDPQISKLP